MPGETCYLAYLLRLWVARHDGVLVCRAVLENPHTGERRAFADLEALFGYLTKEVRQVSQVTPGEEEIKAE